MKTFKSRRILFIVIMGALLIPNAYSQEATVARKVAGETLQKATTEAVQKTVKEASQAGVEKATQKALKEGAQAGLENGGKKAAAKTGRNVVEETLQKEVKETWQGASKRTGKDAIQGGTQYTGTRPVFTGSKESVESSWTSLEEDIWDSAMDKSQKKAVASNVSDEGAEKAAKATTKSKKPSSEKYRRAKELDDQHLSQAEYDKLSPEDKEILDAYQASKYSDRGYQHVPSRNGKWSGERGNSTWRPDRDYVPANKGYNNMKNKTWGQILDENGIDGITYVNGEPDFSAVAKMKTTLDFDTDISDKARAGLLNSKKDRAQLHEEFYEKLARENGMTVDEVKAFKEANNLVVHECSDCKTLMLVPREIHDNVSHPGGVDMFRAFNGL